MASNKSTAHVRDNNKATRESFETEGSASEQSEYRREQDAIEAHRLSQGKHVGA